MGPISAGRGTSPSEHVSPGSGNGVFVPELGRRIRSLDQLTPDQRASLSNNVLFSISRYMADQQSEGSAGITHRRGRRQPSEDNEDLSDLEARVAESVRTAPQASTSQPAAEGRTGRSRSRARRRNVRGRRAREEAGDPVDGGEAWARPVTPFEMDTHGSKMTEDELAIIRSYFEVPDYVRFRLPGPADVPTRPPPGAVAVFRDYFIRGLRLPLHPFIREVLVNLEISLPQLNPNAYQSMVALWALYRLLGFPDLTVEELRAAYSVKNAPSCHGSYYFQSFEGQVITDRDDSMKTWKSYWFWAEGSWEGHPRELAEYGRAVPTTWNLEKQCADQAAISDEGTARIQSILGMPAWRRNSHTLTRTEVLDFTGWLPYRSREEFAEHRAAHPELEPFPPYNFDAPNLAFEEQAEKGVLPIQDYSIRLAGLSPFQ